MNTRFMKTLFLLLALFLFQPSTQATADDTAMQELQAAYFFNFIKFTTWSPQAFDGDTLRIRILRSSQIADAISQAPDQLVHGRTIDVRNCQTPQELLDGHAVFIPTGEARLLTPETWQAFPPRALIVSDWEAVLDNGGTIQLLSMGGRLRFAIDTRHDKSFTVSSKLLRLASEVRR